MLPCGAMTTSSGKCLCGAVKFDAELVSNDFSACHCGMCVRWSGGSAYFAAPTKSVTFQGEENIGRYVSSDWAERGFCKTCGTNLFYFLKPRGAYMMSVGTFDDTSSFAMKREIFIDRKPPGYAFAGDHERWTEAETFAKLAPPKS
jgi:hypothetical protein